MKRFSGIKFSPAHLSAPLLPVAWHCFARQRIADVIAVSAILSTEIDLMILEKSDGNLLFLASMKSDIDGHAQQLVSTICVRAMESVPFVCAVCGAVGSCTQRMLKKKSSWCCAEHADIDPIPVRRDQMMPIKSPWLGLPGKALERMSHPPAHRAACDLAMRYNSPGVRQFIALAAAASAGLAVDEILKTKGKK